MKHQKMAMLVVSCLVICSFLAVSSDQSIDGGRKSLNPLDVGEIGQSASTYITKVNEEEFSRGGTKGDILFYNGTFFYTYSLNGSIYKIPKDVGSSVLSFDLCGDEIYFVVWYSNVSCYAARSLYYNNGTIRTIRLIDPGTGLITSNNVWIIANGQWTGVYLMVYIIKSISSVWHGYCHMFSDKNADYQVLNDLLFTHLGWGYDNYFYGCNEK